MDNIFDITVVCYVNWSDITDNIFSFWTNNRFFVKLPIDIIVDLFSFFVVVNYITFNFRFWN